MRGLSLAVTLVLTLPVHGQTKRPMTYSDTDAWKSISGQKISADGRFLAYGLFPQDGNGEVVVRNLQTKAEIREAAGARPAPPPPDPDREGPPIQRTVSIAFTADSRYAVSTTFPEKGSKAKAVLLVVDLTTMKTTRVADVKSFQMPAEATGVVAFLKDDKEKTLVVHRFSDAAQKTFAGVAEFTVSKDSQTVVYATADGVYALSMADWDGKPRELATGKAKYSKLAWDEKQSQLAFLNETTVFVWDRKPGAAKTVVTNPSAGLGDGLRISERGNLDFSKDGSRLFFSTAPPKPEAKKESGERVNYDLWHWKDEVIQPMQKIRASQERNRSYRAAVQLASGKITQLGDRTMPEISPNDTGVWAIGADDRAYRGMVEYDTRYADQYLVNVATGERKLLGKQRGGNYSWSPDGRYALRFDSKDWLCLNAATGVEANLTAGLGQAFFNEEYDSPGKPNAYGYGGWMKDSKYVLLYDRHDVWQVSPDGKLAKNLTDGVGRRKVWQFRVMRPDSEERAEGFDAAKPLMLRAESLETRESGYFVDTVDGTAEPRQLVWGAKNYGNPLKAKNADVLLTTATTFREPADLLMTNGSFAKFEKVTEANPQLAGFSWGTAELMNFRSNDGVALKAAVYKPEGFDASKKYPLMIYIYERLSQNVNNFTEPRPSNSINVPIYVSNGYVVITPDIAYKLGYPGDSAMSAVLPAVQKLVDQGFIDENRIGIQGHSWGGYQISYMVTRTKMFRAAAPGAVVTNMISAYNGIRWGPGLPRQFQYERTQSRIGGTPWQYPMRFIENSPVFRADQITTPLLMMHNDGDDAVPWYQGIEMFLAMRRLGKEVYMFNYNGEPHNLRIRANQRHCAERLKEFFDFYLMGAPKPEWMEKGRPFLEREPVGRERTPAASEDEPIGER
jgi:dipeptidyl aminopeptidase/acylaminoacyl peptidase